MLAYHNDPAIKIAILGQLKAHHDADEIIKGQYWANGKGCAIGCTIHSGKHIEYESRFGIPVMLAQLEDCIFEGLPNAKAKNWPQQFMKAIKPGSDLSRIGWKFLHWILINEKVNPGIGHPLIRDTVKQCADVLIPLMNGLSVNKSAAESAVESVESAAESAKSAAWSAESAAWSAWSAAESAWSAESAAKSAAWSAESAAKSAKSAAWSAAKSAKKAAWSAWSAARSAESAARSAESAESAESAAESAKSAAFSKMALKLIELLKAA